MRRPTITQYSRALIELTPQFTESDKNLLKAIIHVGDRKLSAKALAAETGYESHSVANALYGRFGHRIWNTLGRNSRDLPRTTGNEPLWTAAIATGNWHVGRWRWRLDPNFVRAVMQVFSPDDAAKVKAALRRKTDAWDDEIEGIEGNPTIRVHFVRERNRTIIEARKRRQILEGKRLECEACGFDFERRYGGRGANYIECHHTKPLSRYVGRGKTKSSDLALVCANCHRMIHARLPWLSIPQLRDILKKATSRKKYART